MRKDILKREKDILEWISQKQSKNYICKQLRCKPETLNFYLDKMEIPYKGNMSGKGIRISTFRKSSLEYLKSSCVKTNTLKQKLIEDGIKESKCEKCKLKEWQNKPIPLELHHIDGNCHNHSLNNLQLLCSNCHSLTDNNAGKNIGSYK